MLANPERISFTNSETGHGLFGVGLFLVPTAATPSMWFFAWSLNALVTDIEQCEPRDYVSYEGIPLYPQPNFG